MNCHMARRMPNRGPRLWLGMFRTVSWLFLLLGLVFAKTVLGAADSALSNSPPSNASTIQLDYQEAAFNVAGWSLSLKTQASPFPKEPAAAPGKTVRGVLVLGDNSSNSIPFLWQRDARKLFLDLNRNRDLTDDSNGMFLARTESSVSYQTFTNVHLLFDTAAGRCPVLADLNLYDYGNSQFGGVVEVRSFWQGKAMLNGRDWQVGIVPINLNQFASFEKSQLLMRSWEKRGQPFTTSSGSLATIPFSRNLFVDGHAYQVNLAVRSQAGEAKPSLKFAGQSVALGEVKIAGKFIQRLVLTGGPYLVCLDQPAGTVEIPIGSYSPSSILLKQGDTEAYQYNSTQPVSASWISVKSNAAVVLNVGGPLTNSVTATRDGQDLSLDYKLIGAGGVTYRLVNQNSSKPPTFAIYKNDREIASDSFQFG
jgi:hypothetical protein